MKLTIKKSWNEFIFQGTKAELDYVVKQHAKLSELVTPPKKTNKGRRE